MEVWLANVSWFCYQLIAKPGNKTAAPPWPDPYHCRSRSHDIKYHEVQGHWDIKYNHKAQGHQDMKYHQKGHSHKDTKYQGHEDIQISSAKSMFHEIHQTICNHKFCWWLGATQPPVRSASYSNYNYVVTGGHKHCPTVDDILYFILP